MHRSSPIARQVRGSNMYLTGAVAPDRLSAGATGPSLSVQGEGPPRGSSCPCYRGASPWRFLSSGHIRIPDITIKATATGSGTSWSCLTSAPDDETVQANTGQLNWVVI
jgi:hypothetical protein